MAYEQTSVAVPKSQDAIRKLIMSHGGFGIAFISDRDPHTSFSQEGLHAKVLIDSKPYAIKIMAVVKPVSEKLPTKQRLNRIEQEERRIWRVLYHHLKSVFEAADSGVMDFRELMLPYILVGEQTISEHILPVMDEAIANPSRMLKA